MRNKGLERFCTLCITVMGVEGGRRQAGMNRRTAMSEKRKSSKPIMEKRRRERINNSLNELKNLLLESRKKDSACCSKLEKADILEMTVRYVKSIRTQQETASTATDSLATAYYRAGFNQSAMEISRYLIETPEIETKVRTRLLAQLSSSCHALLGNEAARKQYYPFYTYEEPSLSKGISINTPSAAVASNEQYPWQIIQPSVIADGKFTLASSPRVTAPITREQIVPIQQLKFKLGCSTSTVTRGPKATSERGQDLPSENLRRSSESDNNSETRSQVSSTEVSAVWRPWS